MPRINTRLIVEIALAVTLALVLNLIPHSIAETFYVEIGVIPMILLSLRRGLKVGLLAGFIWGLLSIVMGAEILQIVQALMEYILAPISIGFAGAFRPRGRGQIIAASFVAVFIKYFWHFLAGIAFWGAYAWPGWSHGFLLVLYSGIANGVSALLTASLAAIVLVLIWYKQPKFFDIID